MNIEIITSKQNELLADIRKLQASRSYRYEKRQFVADGARLVSEAISSGIGIKAIVFCDGAPLPEGIPHGVRVCKISRQLMDYISELEAPQGIIAVCEMPEGSKGGSLDSWFILDGIQDPGNVGTLIRTAEALGISGIILVNGCADVFSPKVVRGTMGAVFRYPALAYDVQSLIDELKRQKIKLIVSALKDDAMDVREVDFTGSAVVIGSEGAGVSKEILTAADVTAIIPISENSESLNAAVAGSIIMWESMKTRI